MHTASKPTHREDSPAPAVADPLCFASPFSGMTTEEHMAYEQDTLRRVSDDDGKTWQGGLVLDEREGLSYPDGFQAPDGKIYITYDLNRASEGKILLARFREKDVLAREAVCADTVLQHCIIQPQCTR